jgi:hypothetical protein
MVCNSDGDSRPFVRGRASLSVPATTALGSDSGAATNCCISAADSRRTLSWLPVFFMGGASATSFLSVAPASPDACCASSDTGDDEPDEAGRSAWLRVEASDPTESSSDGMVGSVERTAEEALGADIGNAMVGVGSGDTSCGFEQSTVADIVTGALVHEVDGSGGILIARPFVRVACSPMSTAPSPRGCAAVLIPPSSPFPTRFSSMVKMKGSDN